MAVLHHTHARFHLWRGKQVAATREYYASQPSVLFYRLDLPPFDSRIRRVSATQIYATLTVVYVAIA